MKVSIKKYAEALAESIEEGKSEEKMKNFLAMMRKKKKGRLLKRFPAVFKEVWNDRKGIVEIKVTTPYELGKAEEEELSERLGKTLKKEIVLEVSVEPRVIGGLKLEFGEYVIDGTVVKNLELLKAKFVSTN
ncbi:MAG: ATP synthase F1 subunit delta [Candidatus Gracilibacteria bacterium]